MRNANFAEQAACSECKLTAPVYVRKGAILAHTHFNISQSVVSLLLSAVYYLYNDSIM